MKSISVLWRRVWPRIIGNLAGGVSSRRKGRRNWSPRAEVLETRALLSSSTQLVLISLDGATSNLIDQYLASGALSTDSGIGYLRTHGVAATQNLTVSPSLTAPGHIAMVTGSTAAYNDVVGNSFRLLASPFSGGTTSGFAAPIGGYDIHGPAEDPTPTATPVWQTLQAAGKTVIAATFAGADGADIKIGTTTVQPAAERTVDYTVPFGAFAGVGAQGFTLTSGDFSAAPSQTQADLTATGHVSYSPVLQKTTKLETISVGGQTYNIQLAALDTTNDSTTNYDTLVFFDTAHGGIAGPFTPSPLGTGAAFVKASDHQSSLFYLEGSSTKAGTSFYVSSLAPDLSTIHLARYSANAIPRNPAVLGDIDDINNNVGFWAPQADFRIPEKLSPGFNNFADSELEAMYEDQVKTFVVYQTNVALWSLQKKPNADLSMFYIEQPDGSQHQFLLT
ncbi:MAG: alkaline phosphatase family protein, partial [Planctomycetota bacterium]|nr:alkaline phosphatase family protein [Planctomycetota bacterium]